MTSSCLRLRILLITDCLQEGLSWKGWEGRMIKFPNFPILCSSWCMLSTCVCCCITMPFGTGSQECVFLQPFLSQEQHEPQKGKKSKFPLLWTVLSHNPVWILKEDFPPVPIWGLMSLCTYQPFSLQFSFYILGSTCTRWLRKQLIQQKLWLLHKGKGTSPSLSIWLLWCFPSTYCLL